MSPVVSIQLRAASVCFSALIWYLLSIQCDSAFECLRSSVELGNTFSHVRHLNTPLWFFDSCSCMSQGALNVFSPMQMKHRSSTSLTGVCGATTKDIVAARASLELGSVCRAETLRNDMAVGFLTCYHHRSEGDRFGFHKRKQQNSL